MATSRPIAAVRGRNLTVQHPHHRRRRAPRPARGGPSGPSVASSEARSSSRWPPCVCCWFVGSTLGHFPPDCGRQRPKSGCPARTTNTHRGNEIGTREAARWFYGRERRPRRRRSPVCNEGSEQTAGWRRHESKEDKTGGPKGRGKGGRSRKEARKAKTIN